MIKFIQIKNLSFSEFTKNTASLFSGNLLGSIVYVLTIPIIARIFNPNDFGNFQLLFSIVAIFSIISCFRYESAIVLANNKDEVKTAGMLSFYILGISSLILFVFFILFNNLLFNLLNASDISEFYHLIILAIFLEGILSILSQLIIEKGDFRNLAINRFIQLSGYGLLPLALGLWYQSFLILFISRIITYVFSITLLWKNSDIGNVIFQKPNWNSIKNYGIKHKKLPLYLVPSNFLNNLSIEMPVFMLFKYFGETEVGYYAMAMRILQMPIGLISNSVRDVYYREASKSYQKSPQDLMNVFKKTLKQLGLISMVMLMCSPLIPFTIPLFLGEHWKTSGNIMLIILPYLCVNLVSSTLSTTYIILLKQQYLFYGSIIYLFTCFFSIKYFNSSLFDIIVVYSLISFIYYSFHIIINYFQIKNSY